MYAFFQILIIHFQKSLKDFIYGIVNDLFMFLVTLEIMAW